VLICQYDLALITGSTNGKRLFTYTSCGDNSWHVSPTTEEESITLGQLVKAMQEVGVGVRFHIDAAYLRSSTGGYFWRGASEKLVRVNRAREMRRE
jgi:hypothetical protein